jgi:hypothetical protein
MPGSLTPRQLVLKVSELFQGPLYVSDKIWHSMVHPEQPLGLLLKYFQGTSRTGSQSTYHLAL